MDGAIRRTVRTRLDPALVREAVDALTARAPSDRIRVIDNGWQVREDIPWFALFAAVALFALSLIAHAGLAKAPGFPRSFRALPWLFDLSWVACAYLFARKVWGAMSITLDGETVVIERTMRDRSVKRCAIDAEEIQAVRVLRDRVVSIEGPRNQTLATVFTAGALDPPPLARWIADAIVALAERSLAR